MLNISATKEARKRRYVRFSLRALLVMVAVVGIVVAPYVNRLHKRQRAIARIEALGGSISGTSVSLKGSGAVDDDLIHLRHLRNVTALDLADTRITDRGLRSLHTVPNIWIVNLRGTQVTDEGLLHLKVLSRLRELILDDTRMTGQGLQHLRGLPDLRTLRLQGTLINDANLSQLRHLSALRQVMLAGTPITDAGLEHLKMLNGLRAIFLHDTGSGIPRDVPAGVTDEGIASLQRSLPNCNIWYDRGFHRVSSSDGK